MKNFFEIVVSRIKFPLAVFFGVCTAFFGLLLFLYSNPDAKFNVLGHESSYIPAPLDHPFWLTTAGFGIYDNKDACERRSHEISQHLEDMGEYNSEDKPPTIFLVNSDENIVLQLRCFNVNNFYFLQASMASSQKLSEEFKKIYSDFSDS